MGGGDWQHGGEEAGAQLSPGGGRGGGSSGDSQR